MVYSRSAPRESLWTWNSTTSPSSSSAATDQASAVFPQPASPVTSSGASTASAVLTALCGAGLPTDRFHFLGFLPVKKGKATRLLESVAELKATLVLYVSPYKLGSTLPLLVDVLGDRPACLCRELTKIHETFDRRPLSALAEHYSEGKVKGEITLVIGRPERAPKRAR